MQNVSMQSPNSVAFRGIKVQKLLKNTRRIAETTVIEAAKVPNVWTGLAMQVQGGQPSTAVNLLSGISAIGTKICFDLSGFAKIMAATKAAKAAHPSINEATRFSRLMKTRMSPLNITQAFKKPLAKKFFPNN